MALLKYGFVLKSRINVNPPSTVDLPDPSGILSKSIPSSTIKAANTAVRDVSIDSQNEAPDAKRGRYQHYSDKERAEIAVLLLFLRWNVISSYSTLCTSNPLLKHG